jgi:hypothetical protein
MANLSYEGVDMMLEASPVEGQVSRQESTENAPHDLIYHSSR